MSVTATISRHFSSLEDLYAIITGGKTKAELSEESFAKGYDQNAKINRELRKKIADADPYRHRNLQAELEELEGRVSNTKECVDYLESERDTLTEIIKDATKLIEKLEATQYSNNVDHARQLRRMKLQPAQRNLERVENRIPGMRKVLQQWESALKEWKKENSSGLKAQREQRELSREVRESTAGRF